MFVNLKRTCMTQVKSAIEVRLVILSSYSLKIKNNAQSIISQKRQCAQVSPKSYNIKLVEKFTAKYTRQKKYLPRTKAKCKC